MNKTKKIDQELGKVAHYKKHPQMIPFVGKYWGDYLKLLIIAESHYLDGKDNYKEIIKNWYQIEQMNLILSPGQKKYTTTATIVKSKGHSIFRNLENAIKDLGFIPEHKSNLLNYTAYINFFQRPAEETGQSVNDITDEDIMIANQTLSEVIRIIEPDYVFFVSKKAEKYFDNSLFDKNKTGLSCHPSSPHWNRKSYFKKTTTGKEVFQNFLRKNEIFIK